MEDALVLRTRLETKNFERQIADVENQIKGISKALATAKPGDDVREMTLEIEKLKNKLVSLYAQQNKINSQGFKKVKESLNGVQRSASNVGKSIVRWGLALIGVRSAMSLIRSSLSTLSEYDDQLAKNVEYIRYVIAMALKPLIEYIVNLVFTLLQYINYIAMAWFNVNLFANASAESMEKTNKSSKSLAKNIKEAKKDLLGFDQINKLNAQASSSAGGGESSALPSVDLSRMLTDQDVPEWLKWLKDNKDLILSLLAGIATFLTAIKLGFSAIKSLGFGMIVMGIVGAFQKLSEWFSKVAEQNGVLTGLFNILGQAIAYIGIAIAGVGIVIGSVAAALIALWVGIVAYIVYFTDEVVNSQNEIRQSWDEIAKWLRSNLGALGDFIDGVINDLIGVFDGLLIGLWQGFSTLIGGILLLFSGDLSNGLKQIFRGIVNMIIGILNAAISSVNAVLIPARALIYAYGVVTNKGWNFRDISIPHIPYVATGAIINYPGKGVPISAMGGERGAEGVIPLTDNQAMETLGEQIGRHVKVNLDLINEINGRVFSRVMKQINSEDEFARNGG